jgi:hypothetical protein
MRVVIYARVSTKDQSCDMQLRDLRAYCAARGFASVREFLDVGSGAKDSRPQLNDLMAAARKCPFDAVVVWRLDRFAGPPNICCWRWKNFVRSARGQAKRKGEPEEKAKPKPEMQYNFTDPESRIMPGGDGFVQGYNAQIAVEPDFPLIVGQGVTQDSNDKQQMKPMVEAIGEQAGQKPEEVLTDSEYCSEANLKYLERKNIEGFIATDRESDRSRQQAGPRGPLPKEATRVDRMRRKLQTKAGAAIYSRRKTVTEPVFGQIKQARGFRQFLLRGLRKVQGEWAMICLTHNILKLHRLCLWIRKRPEGPGER